MKCSICGKEIKHPLIKDYLGNNPYPVRTDENARCCDECNDKYVLFFRIGLFGAKREVVEETAECLNGCNKHKLDVFVELGSMA